jgi:hypothetical protein
MRLFVGNGIGPLILASVAVAASMILSHAACMCDVSNDFKRILIFDAATGAAAVFRRERERQHESERISREILSTQRKECMVKRKRRRQRREDCSRARALSSGEDASAIARAQERAKRREREQHISILSIFFQVFTPAKKEKF